MKLYEAMYEKEVNTQQYTRHGLNINTGVEWKAGAVIDLAVFYCTSVKSSV